MTKESQIKFKLWLEHEIENLQTIRDRNQDGLSTEFNKQIDDKLEEANLILKIYKELEVEKCQ